MMYWGEEFIASLKVGKASGIKAEINPHPQPNPRPYRTPLSAGRQVTLSPQLNLRPYWLPNLHPNLIKNNV